MIKQGIKKFKVLILTGILPFIYGCGGGGGGLSALTDFLFGGGGGSGSSLLGIGAGVSGTLSSVAGIGGGSEIATIVHPEPASMVLLGSGLVAMKYFQSRKNRKTMR